jgi:hypothetical protein
MRQLQGAGRGVSWLPSMETDRQALKEEGIAHRVASREANERKARETGPAIDERALLELACECTKVDCERSVKVPLYVYRRLVVAGNQYLLQAGHHAFPRYRTIVETGLMRIEEPSSLE